MKKINFKCNVNEHEILEAINNHDCYDSWGDVMYENGRQAVEYNICIDNSTDKTEYLSAFYRLSKGKDGVWQHDSCQEWYAYEIDFTNNNWKEKLREAAIKAYKTLWKKIN